jgi:hypothetical protein
MKIRTLVMIAALGACGQALAQYQELPTVEVRGATYPDDHAALSFACGNLREPSAAEVESLLKVGERGQTPRLSNELMAAVREACDAGVPMIVVARSQSGQGLLWHPVDM